MFKFNLDKSIVVQTRRGTNINNFQNPSVSEFNINIGKKIESKYIIVEKRTHTPTGLYNCHGLTFANRRCFIGDAKDVLTILQEDDYSEVFYKDILPGDIIIYFSEGDPEHSGIVVSKPEAPLYVPLICSKWGCHLEVIHYSNYCPYDKTNIKYFRVR